jgi:anti-sigma regulatory factor (Ser/Thr protein kinase)
MIGPFELTVDNNLAHLSDISGFILEMSERCGLSKEEQFQVRLAVDEASTNVISYAYGDQKGELTIRCWCEDGVLTVELLDRGRPFDPTKLPPPNLEADLRDRPLGGLGVYLIQRFMDQVHYTRDDDGVNRLTMVKRVCGFLPSGTAQPSASRQ